MPSNNAPNRSRGQSEAVLLTSSASQQPLKWIKSVRALSSAPENNDFLKTEYIEVNLNNLRKLIQNVRGLTSTSDEAVSSTRILNDSLLRLNNVRAELAWADGLAPRVGK